MRECVDYLLRRRDEVRPGAPLDIGFFPGYLYVGDPAWDTGPHAVTGSPEAIAASLREARDYGCNVLHLHFRSRDAQEMCDQVAAFGDQVAPLLN
jgi:hypothetical protein